MKNGSVFILWWGAISSFNLRKKRTIDERQIRKGPVARLCHSGECAAIMFKEWCIKCIGLGANH